MVHDRLSIDSPPDEAVATLYATPAPKQISSSALFGAAREIRIDHDGQAYRLRKTRNEKLILTK